MGNHLTRGTAAEQRALRAAIRDTGLLTMEAAAVRIVAALHAAGERILPMTEPPVLWEGDLGELMHAVNGTPIMSALLDAFPADEPDQWQVRIQRVIGEGTPT